MFMNQLQITLNKIKNVKIQGANAIALASLNTLAKYAQTLKEGNFRENRVKLLSAISQLSLVRPTEPFNQNLLRSISAIINQNKISAAGDFKELITGRCSFLKKLINDNAAKIAVHGSKLVRTGQKIFTHCHSKTVEDIFIKAKKQNKVFSLFNTETRPLFQGRITAKNLLEHKIPVTMVADSAAEFLISETSGKDLMMDLVILGADAILPDGSIINKIGSYGIALSCFYTKVPLYIACSLLKLDADGVITIELRSEQEIWPHKPKNLRIINFAFDKIPAQFITGFITEFGLIKPRQAFKLAKSHYPWIK